MDSFRWFNITVDQNKETKKAVHQMSVNQET